MLVKINGTETEIRDGLTLEDLLAALDVKKQGIAVDINREVVPKRLYNETRIKEGDSIEIIRMVGGG